ncbi:MAG: phosphatase [Lagierella massiliensis]|nr:phosphatase [Lagierella massiliensis]
MKYGIIDIGSNTIRLNLYLVDEDKNIFSLTDKKYVAGIASYVNKGYLTKKGTDKIVNILEKLFKLCETFGVDKVYPFATASLRNIKNSDEVLEYIHEKIGREIDLVSGEEEANLGYLGVKQDYYVHDGYIIDIGGGSTEITLVKKGLIKYSTSLKIGSLSLQKKYCDKIIPSKNEAKKMKENVRSSLKESKIPVLKGRAEAFGIGGTIRACGNVSMELFDLTTPQELTTDLLKELYNNIIDQRKKVIRKILQVNPARVHTITPGMIILKEVLKYLDVDELYISNKGAREGYLNRVLD